MLARACWPAQAKQEALFARLSEEDLEGYLNLEHVMQRIPYAVPETASVRHTYRMFR